MGNSESIPTDCMFVGKTNQKDETPENMPVKLRTMILLSL